jgi:hypothetical protein
MHDPGEHREVPDLRRDGGNPVKESVADALHRSPEP